MDVHVAVLCDFAADYQGKLCITGAFDHLGGPRFPLVHPQCTVALRIGFRLEDEGHHDFAIRLVDEDGVDLIKPLQPSIDVTLPENVYFISRNLVINLQRMQFPKPGLFSVDISANEKMIAQIPLQVVQLQAPPNS